MSQQNDGAREDASPLPFPTVREIGAGAPFGWIARGSKPRTATLHLPGDRAAVRDASVDAALSGLLELVGENPL